jgi:hypothetical protein
MTSSRLEQAVVAGAVAYLAAVTWMMANVSFDLWGAFVVGPVLALIGLWSVRRLFPGPLRPVAVILSWGLLAKLAGTLARYWVSMEAYGGSVDANRYHQFAVDKLSRIRAGQESWWAAFPAGRSTHFIENLTTALYTITGPTKLGGFLVFGFVAYLGVLFFVKAAIVAVPGLAGRRYALLCAFAPSILYWPSSIGKEAWMLATLGLGTYAIARLLSRQGVLWPLVLASLGLGLASVVRPHMVLLWLAGGVAALIVALMRGRGAKARTPGHAWDRVLVAVIIVMAVVGLAAMAQVTVRQLNFAEETTVSSDSVSAILAETTRRTEQAGSNFRPPTVDGVTDWPYAVVRTLTRPLLVEANGVVQLITALELTLFGALCVLWWGRTKYLPWAVFAVPYVAFAMATLFLVGLAYSSFANLGVLARQKSLIFPFLMLIPCVPVRPKRPPKSALVERSLPDRRNDELAAIHASV